MIQPKNFFLLRQPTYSINTLFQFYNRLAGEELSKHTGRNGEFIATSLSDLLRQHYNDPVAQQAIFVASPALYERFQRWLSGDILPEQDKLLITLHKYLIRMCSRPTPYGLFAGCTVGHFGEHTQFRAGTATTLRTHTRMDMDCLLAICQWLSSQPIIRTQLRLFPNSSLYPIGSSLRYIEQQFDNKQRSYFISVAEAELHLTTVLEAARTGATIQELATTLTTLNIDQREAVSFVEQLIEGQLLSFEIEPTVTGLHYLNRLTERMASLTGTIEITEQLRQLQASLQQPDRLLAYSQVQEWFANHSIRLPSADIVQADAFFDNPTLQLSRHALQLVQRDLEKLLVLNQSNDSPDLDEFKRRFYNRYEDEEVPLALVIDAESGIGYGSGSTFGVGYAPLIDDLTFVTSPVAQTTTWDWWQTLVMDKYTQALRTNRTAGAIHEIVLTEDDLTYISSQAITPSVPDSFYAFGTLLASSAKAVDEGDFQFNLVACKGPSAINLLSRFGEGNEPLAQQIKQCALAEENYHPDVIIAEIVHLPENRVGNILIRPTTHQYEIPYMGQSSVEPDYQIPLTDLLVSVHYDETAQGRIILRSKRLNKRIIPRLSNAHNFSQGLPIYRFLCDLQAQDSHLNIAWNWGVLRTQTYLPRVRYRNIIVSRATWQLACTDLTPDNPLRLVAQLTAAGLPDQFVIAQGDNELFISMHTPASLALLVQEIRRLTRAGTSGHIKLVEFLSMPDRSPLTNKRHHFTHEVLIPFQNVAAKPFPGLSQSPGVLPQRKFSIGSEWFYLKVYTGEKTSDTLLTETIYPAVKQLLKTQIIDEFFFVRYKDSDAHLRLRFRGNAHLEFYHHVVRVMEKALHEAIQSGIVHSIKVDTYQRELERYGIEHMPLCETLFYYDSLSTLAFIARTGNEFDENLRFAIAIRKIDKLLVGAGLAPDACLNITGELKERFFQEFGGSSELRHQLNEKYRMYRPLMDQALADDFPMAGDLTNWEHLQAELVQKLVRSSPNSQHLYTILSSVIHMLVNRLFPSKQRAYELVLYHCLARHYDSLRARQAVVDA